MNQQVDNAIGGFEDAPEAEEKRPYADDSIVLNVNITAMIPRPKDPASLDAIEGQKWLEVKKDWNIEEVEQELRQFIEGALAAAREHQARISQTVVTEKQEIITP